MGEPMSDDELLEQWQSGTLKVTGCQVCEENGREMEDVVYDERFGDGS